MAAYDFPDTAGKPTDGSFEYTAPDGTLYEWNGYAWVVPTDESGGGSGGAARVLTQVLPPSPAEDGDMYWCTDDGRLYLYYDDADTKQWVDASPDGGGNNVEKLIAGDNITLSPADGKGVVTINSTGGGGGTSTPQKIATIAEIKPNNTSAGASIPGWQTRGLSTITSDENNLATLSANVFTLKAGTYLIQWSVPGYKVDRMNSRLKSGSTVVAEGSAIYAGAAESSQIISTGSAYVNITADTQYQIEHYCQTGNAQGLGIASNSGQNEVYTQVTITDLSSGGGGGGSGGGPTTPGVRYQQGKITPNVDGGVSLTDSKGFWSRIGNNVSVQYYIRSASTGTGIPFALSLPFISSDNYTENGSSVGSVMFSAVNIGDDRQLTPYIAAKSTTVKFFKSSQLGAVWVELLGSDVGVESTFFIQINYLTDDTTYVPALEAVVTEDIQGTGGSGGDGTTVNYNGASAWASVDANGTIQNGQNVASVNKTAAGTYGVTFTTPMPHANYAVTTGGFEYGVAAVGKTTLGFTIVTAAITSTAVNTDSEFGFAVFSENAIAPQSGVGADAWGSFRDDNNPAYASYNCSSERISEGNFKITFGVPMPNTNYAVTVTGNGPSSSFTFVYGKTVNDFTVGIRDGAGVAKNTDFSVVVHASSTVTPTYTWTRDGTTLKPANDGDAVEIAGQLTTAFNQPSGFVSSIVNTSTTGGDGLYLNVKDTSSAIVVQRQSDSQNSVLISGDGSAKFGRANLFSSRFVMESGMGLWFTGDAIVPTLGDSVGNAANNQKDLGSSTVRWRNVYGTSARIGNVVLELEQDDDTKYTSTTDSEGNETRVYNGAALDVKSLLLTLQTAAARIATLEAKVATLESDHTTLMNNNNNNGGGY